MALCLLATSVHRRKVAGKSRESRGKVAGALKVAGKSRESHGEVAETPESRGKVAGTIRLFCSYKIDQKTSKCIETHKILKKAQTHIKTYRNRP